MRPGYKTTEFWLSLIAMVLGALMASGLVVEGTLAAQVIGGVMAILANLGYVAARAQAKALVEPAVPAVPPVSPPELK